MKFLLFALVLAVASATMSAKDRRLGNSEGRESSSSLWSRRQSEFIEYRKSRCLFSDTMLFFRHGSMECSDGSEHNSVCRFWCKPGYKLYGSSARTCEKRLGRYSEWTGETTRCVPHPPVFCSVSEEPRNGRMRCSDEDYKYASRCWFACLYGYKLIGSNERVCQEDGKWSGTKPMCSRFLSSSQN